jgi:hypothetical protein
MRGYCLLPNRPSRDNALDIYERYSVRNSAGICILTYHPTLCNYAPERAPLNNPEGTVSCSVVHKPRFCAHALWLKCPRADSVTLRAHTAAVSSVQVELPFCMFPRFKERPVSTVGIVGSNPTQSMDVCLHLFCVCVYVAALRRADHSSKSPTD